MILVITYSHLVFPYYYIYIIYFGKLEGPHALCELELQPHHRPPHWRNNETFKDAKHT